ncbi:MAG: sialidase family protein [Terriglobales bacterium]
MPRTVVLVKAVLLVIVVVAISAVAQENTLTQQTFPERWDRPVPAGSALAEIKDTYQKRRAVRMIATDLADVSPLPFWFRAYLRDQLPGLPTTGSYQYPRVAEQVFEWMLTHPDLKARLPKIQAGHTAARSLRVGGNINISNLDERNSESVIAVDYNHPNYLIAASNNITGSGHQKQFYSSDAGLTWGRTELPLATGKAMHSDPAVGFTSNGTAWTATLGIANTGGAVDVQVYKSSDHGATWTFVSTVSAGTANDKEMMWIDPDPASPFKDSIYLAWDQPGKGIRFTRSTDMGSTWAAVTSLSDDGAIGVHLTTGPGGELFVAWPDTISRELRVRKSSDGGATFEAMKRIAITNASYEIAVPAFCNRDVLIYLTLGVDRSQGPHNGHVYAAWTDRNDVGPDPGCNGIASSAHTNVYFSSSQDAGANWGAPRVVHAEDGKSDHFNQWMDVDPNDGRIHVIFYDTRDDAGRKKTNVYDVASTDGGANWTDELKVTTGESDETVEEADQGNQYGDYNGLVAFRGVSHPIWTDRRSSNPGSKEQIYSSNVAKAAGHNTSPRKRVAR